MSPVETRKVVFEVLWRRSTMPATSPGAPPHQGEGEEGGLRNPSAPGDRLELVARHDGESDGAEERDPAEQHGSVVGVSVQRRSSRRATQGVEPSGVSRVPMIHPCGLLAMASTRLSPVVARQTKAGSCRGRRDPVRVDKT
jgi:hypothetical protein